MKLVIIGVVALLLLGGGGGGAYFFLFAPETDADATEEQAVTEEAPVYVDMKTISAPVRRRDNRQYYMHLGISLHLENDGVKERAYKLMPRLRDAFLHELHSRSILMEGNRRAVDFPAVKQRLIARAEKILGPESVRDVLVTTASGG